jgi:hypothetical protein
MMERVDNLVQMGIPSNKRANKLEESTWNQKGYISLPFLLKGVQGASFYAGDGVIDNIQFFPSTCTYFSLHT